MLKVIEIMLQIDYQDLLEASQALESHFLRDGVHKVSPNDIANVVVPLLNNRYQHLIQHAHRGMKMRGVIRDQVIEFLQTIYGVGTIQTDPHNPQKVMYDLRPLLGF
jgi:hypothetical protein